MKRYRHIHDFIHVLLGFDITVPDEIIVKWFEYAHFGLPMTGLSAVFGPLNVNGAEREHVRKYIPWALYNGYNSKLMLNVYFEQEFEKDLMVLKREFDWRETFVRIAYMNDILIYYITIHLAAYLHNVRPTLRVPVKSPLLVAVLNVYYIVC